MLGIHENVLDFEILETGNTKTLVFVDSSIYIEEPDRPLLETIMPGYTKYLLTNVAARTINTFNSSTLGFNKVLNQDALVDLPDGVWQFKYKICPYKYIYKVKKHMRVTLLLNKLKQLHDYIDLGECIDTNDVVLKEYVVNISILIQGAQLIVEKDSKKAQSYYQLADKLVQKALDKFCKNCK